MVLVVEARQAALETAHQRFERVDQQVLAVQFQPVRRGDRGGPRRRPGGRSGLETLYQSLNPLRLRRQIDAELERLWALAASSARPTQPEDEPDPVTATSEAPIRFGNRYL